MNVLKEKFEETKNKYSEIKHKCERKVMKWKWSKGYLYHIEAFNNERNEQSKGELLESRPLKPQNCIQYGFDDHKRLIVIRILSDSDFDVFYEEFFLYDNDIVESYYFSQDEDKQLIRIKEYFYEKSKLAYINEFREGYSENFWSQEKYKYRDGLLVTIETKSSQSLDFEEVEFQKTIELFEYDIENTLSSIKKTWFQDGINKTSEYLSYQSMDTTLSIEKVIDYIKEELVKKIKKTILKEKFNEPIYAVVLDYGMGGSEFIPYNVYVGLESDRKYILENYESYEEGNIWYSGEFETILQPDFPTDPHWEKYQAMFNSYVIDHEAYDQVVKLAEGMCFELNSVNWKELITISDDFVLFPMNYDEENYEKVFKKFVPSSLVEEFKNKKWL